MSLNQFLFDHQLAAMRIGLSGSAEEREEAVDLTGRLAKRIADWRCANGLPSAGWPRDERPPFADLAGMLVVPAAIDRDQRAAGAWENEGGALKPEPAAALPQGIVAVHSVHYRVGPFSYSRLEDAMAEHLRQSGA